MRRVLWGCMRLAFAVLLGLLLSVTQTSAQSDRPATTGIIHDATGQIGTTHFNPACFTNPSGGEFGNASGYLSQLRNPAYASKDMGVSKPPQFGGDRRHLRLHFQMFSVFNRRGFSGPNPQIGTADFAKVLPEYRNGAPGPRVGQFGARFTF